MWDSWAGATSWLWARPSGAPLAGEVLGTGRRSRPSAGSERGPRTEHLRLGTPAGREVLLHLEVE